MEKLLAAWKLGTIQMALQINDKLAKEEKTWEDVRQFLSKRRHHEFRDKAFASVLCPVCRRPMAIFPVNSGPRDQVGGDYKSQWYCMRCDHSLFNKLTVEEEIDRTQYRGKMIKTE